MPRFFYGNFDFEYELAAAAGRAATAPEQVRRMNAALAAAWLGVARPDDFVLAPAPWTAADFPDLVAGGLDLPRFVTGADAVPASSDIELVPWGWSPRVVALARAYDWKASAPPLDVVRAANAREFRWRLERDLGVALAGSGVAKSLDDLRRLIAGVADEPRGWILKANFGMSGRESLRGRGGTLSEPICRWAERRLAVTGAIVVEPLLERIAEDGVQIEIPGIGPPQLIGLAESIVDDSGVYRGSRFEGLTESAATVPSVPPLVADAWRPAIEVALTVAARLQSLGYFGPLGIDCMRFRDADGQSRLRPLQDLNARFTLGRLALEHRRLVPPGSSATWRWLRPEDAPSSALLGADDAQRIIRTSPRSTAAGDPYSVLLVSALDQS